MFSEYFDNNYFFFYTDRPLQGFRSHCSVRGYSSLLVATAEAEATTRTGRQHTHTHAHTQPPTQPFITSKHDMKSLLVREQVDGSTLLSTKTKYIQGHSTKLLLPEDFNCEALNLLSYCFIVDEVCIFFSDFIKSQISSENDQKLTYLTRCDFCKLNIKFLQKEI